MVTGGKSLKAFHEAVCVTCPKIRQTFWIMIFASVHFILAQMPTLNSIAGVSFAAAVMSVSYSTIAWSASAAKGNDGASYIHYPDVLKASEMFGAFNALGQLAFAVVLEIQATMPSTPERPSKVPMWRGVVLAYAIVALCYFPVAFVGYWAFGNTIKDDVLMVLKHPRWLIATANMMVVIHLIGGYQIYAMPIYDMMETLLVVKKLHLPPGILLRVIVRSAYVAFTCFAGISIPFFSALLGFFGGFAFTPTTYFVCIILGVLLMIAASIGGLHEVIVSAHGYKFFS